MLLPVEQTRDNLITYAAKRRFAELSCEVFSSRFSTRHDFLGVLSGNVRPRIHAKTFNEVAKRLIDFRLTRSRAILESVRRISNIVAEIDRKVLDCSLIFKDN